MEFTVQFPDPRKATNEGLVAVGGELNPNYLISAYAQGLYPWFNEEDPILWWCPNPRMVLFPNKFKTSKSLRQIINNKKFELKIDSNFKEVITNCGKTNRKEQDGTWITEDILDAYSELHELGVAHSFESYKDGELVGGLYGLSFGKAFFGESMFFTESNASKFAFYYLVEWCKKNEIHFIDAQQSTNHLMSLGAEDIPRDKFLDMLEEALNHKTIIGNWKL